MTPEQRQAAQQVLSVIADTIKESPEGCPLGPLYAALMARGMSYDTFTNIIGTMQSIGLVKVSNNCAFWIAGRLQ